MEICIVGLGSIGTRHLTNLSMILSNRKVTYAIDALRSSDSPLPDEVACMIREEYYNPDDLPNVYDIIIISNPTVSHYTSLRSMIPKAQHIFIEKPIFDNADYKLRDLRLKQGGIYYVACPLRHHSVVRYLKTFIESNSVYSVRAICSSYLPEWRPGTDYRKCYSAIADMGGGVRLDLIHEWDYLWYLFGEPVRVQETHGTFSNLGISSDDVAVYIADYPDKLVSLHLDYFGRFARREIELYTENDVLVGDLIARNIRSLQSKQVVDLPQGQNDIYIAEMSGFLDMTEGNAYNYNDIDTAMKVLSMATGKKQS